MQNEEGISLGLESAAQRLAREFAGVFSQDTVDEVLRDSLQDLESTATVRVYVGIFAERFARERLQTAAQASGAIPSDVPEVLFVCVHNAGRSQMAAALLHHQAKGIVHVRSAGSTPAGEINLTVRSAMDEIGVDLSHEFPKPLTDEVVRAADIVITMGCGDACPVYPGKRYLDWDLPDPAERSLNEVRGIRDEIDRRVAELLADLVTARSAKE